MWDEWEVRSYTIIPSPHGLSPWNSMIRLVDKESGSKTVGGRLVIVGPEVCTIWVHIPTTFPKENKQNPRLPTVHKSETWLAMPCIRKVAYFLFKAWMSEDAIVGATKVLQVLTFYLQYLTLLISGKIFTHYWSRFLCVHIQPVTWCDPTYIYIYI